MDTKTHVITPELLAYRERDRCCPICNDGTRIIKRPGIIKDDNRLTGVRLAGWFWVCQDNPDDYDHYNLSPGGGKLGSNPRETNGSSVPRHMLPNAEERPSGPRVVKRDRDGNVTALVR